MVYNGQVAEMIDAFRRLPGAGPKSAPKMVYYLLNRPDEEVFRFAESIIEANKKIKYCRKCCTITNREICPICSSGKRDGTVIMVVENPREIDVYEKTKKYNGLYHVLNGLICPSMGVTDKDIRLKELVVRLMSEPVKEIILSLDFSQDGEHTSGYIADLVKPAGIRVSRILSGVPVGAEIENLDETTLEYALENRHEI